MYCRRFNPVWKSAAIFQSYLKRNPKAIDLWRTSFISNYFIKFNLFKSMNIVHVIFIEKKTNNFNKNNKKRKCVNECLKIHKIYRLTNIFLSISLKNNNAQYRFRLLVKRLSGGIRTISYVDTKKSLLISCILPFELHCVRMNRFNQINEWKKKKNAE